MIIVTPFISLDDSEIEETFIRASGPGGQNVNKVASAVQLRFDAARSPALYDELRARLAVLAGSRMTMDGVIVIRADRFRTQERNRQDALDRLIDLIRRAAVRPAIRRPTKPTRAAKARRVDDKKRRSEVKGQRQHRPEQD